MVIEENVPSIFQWFPKAALDWAILVLVFFLLLGFLGMLFSGLRLGPANAFKLVLKTAGQTLRDVFSVSFKTVWALASLTFKEAIRRKIVIVFIIFVLIVLFAGMFLDPTSPHPAQLYVDFIFGSTAYLTIILMILLTAFSLPADFKNKTIHTVVTKPVLISEIILGRVLGFVLLGTMLLVPMGLVSYGFVIRSQAHTHTVPDGLTQDKTNPALERGVTSNEREHRHEIVFDKENQVVHLTPTHDHTHEISVREGKDGERHFTLSQPIDMYKARVVQYGEIGYLDQKGIVSSKGVNVGDEWEYRSFIAGNTDAAFIWQFENITPASLVDDALQFEFTQEVFRTHKGVISRQIIGAFYIRNPETGLMLEVEIFQSKEGGTSVFRVPRTINISADKMNLKSSQRNPNGTSGSRASAVSVQIARQGGELQSYPPEDKLNIGGANRAEFDLFKDFVAPQSSMFDEKGREIVRQNVIEVWVKCLERGQYFGAAKPDMYLRRADASFAWNFFKGYVGIWFQMVMISMYGVIFSTFLSTPVTVLATFFVTLGGYFHKFVAAMGTQNIEGGGPFEAAIRLFRQDNMTIDLDMNAGENILAKMFDTVFHTFIRFLGNLVPAFDSFDTSAYVAQGFNISFNTVLINLCTVLGYAIPLYVLGYICLKMREIEQ
ncbi:MAG: hypothetical protein IJK97_14865 [Thermoguttaceae bacterium]|nr:hypothetical protein [Thermoguttaceae bacterium]MBR0191174.1 hypothetical protein [Thermoguttaceae bacterium]